MKIMKFGGTSVGSSERIKEVAALLCKSKDNLLVVLSAMSGTTNALVEISKHYYAGETDEAEKIANELEHKYFQHVEALYSTPEYKEKLQKFIHERFDFIRSFGNDYFSTYEEKQILAQGEILSTNMMVGYLKENKVNAVLLNALDFVFTNKNSEPDLPKIRQHLSAVMEQNQGVKLYITQGYICTNAFGEIDNLQRGGSDYTASLLGAVLPAEEIQIWTDIDGIHNNDPRFVENTTSIRNISFAEAAELAYFGAKILHPTCVQPAKDANVPIRLKYTMDPEAEGTLIVGDIDKGRLKAIAAKDNMTVMNIQSKRNVTSNIFLKKTLEVFETYSIAIDMMTTSEVAVAICFETNGNIEKIKQALHPYAEVSIENDMCIVCAVGDFDWENDTPSLQQRILRSLKQYHIKMIGYGGSRYNISVVISANDKQAVLQQLNNDLF